METFKLTRAELIEWIDATYDDETTFELQPGNSPGDLCTVTLQFETPDEYIQLTPVPCGRVHHSNARAVCHRDAGHTGMHHSSHGEWDAVGAWKPD